MNHIIFVYNNDLGQSNGSCTHITEVTQKLSSVSQITVFAKKTSTLKIPGTKLIRIPVTKNRYIDLLFYQIMLLFYMIPYCISTKPDLIYARQEMLSFTPLIIAKLFRLPYVVEINGLIIDEAHMSKRPGPYISLLRISERLNYRYCDRIIAITDGIKKGIAQSYNIPEKSIEVIGNGANIDLFRPMEMNRTKKELGLEPSNEYICFVGNLAEWQGVEYILRASPLVIREKPQVHFLIIGDGEIKGSLENIAHKLEIQDRIHFIGRVDYIRVPYYINASHIGLAPFIKKRNQRIGLSPLKLYEYMACARPVITSQLAGVEQIIRDSGGGCAIEPEKPQKLACAILKLLIDPQLCEKMGLNGCRYVNEKHSWTGVSEKVYRVCEDLIEINHRNK